MNHINWAFQTPTLTLSSSFFFRPSLLKVLISVKTADISIDIGINLEVSDGGVGWWGVGVLVVQTSFRVKL